MVRQSTCSRAHRRERREIERAQLLQGTQKDRNSRAARLLVTPLHAVELEGILGVSLSVHLGVLWNRPQGDGGGGMSMALANCGCVYVAVLQRLRGHCGGDHADLNVIDRCASYLDLILLAGHANGHPELHEQKA